MKNILAIDIGGSKILAGLVDETGQVIKYTKTPLHKATQESLLSIIFSECDDYITHHEISAISASIPGLTDSVNGIWVEAAFSNIRNFPLGRELADRYHCPVFLENDANNCAYGEKLFGHAKNIDDFLWLTVSNGCGSGIFLNGRLFTGYGGNAGEIGHIRVTDEYLICSCGNKGCLEAAAAGPGISTRYKNLTGKSLDAKEIAFYAGKGDETAVSVFKKTGEYIGKAVASAVNILNVPLAIIGGGVSLSYNLMKDEIEKTVQSHIYRMANKNLVIKQTKLGYHASLIGAAAKALMHEKTDME